MEETLVVCGDIFGAVTSQNPFLSYRNGNLATTLTFCPGHEEAVKNGKSGAQ